jgi:class 3 adenylate cyclase
MHYEMTVDIDRPIQVVWEWVNDWFNIPRLRGQALVFRQTSPGPIGMGTTYEGRVMILGFETRVRGSIVEWNPPYVSAADVEARPLKSFKARETLEETSNGTRLVRSMEIEPRWFYRLLWPILGPPIVRRWRVATDNIKTMLESTPPDPGESELVGPTVHRTIMVTDIVGSTALIEVIGDAAWRDLRRWHDTTLRAAFDRHHGRELDHAGDGFCAAFGSSAEAVACAVDVQRTLIEHRRSAGFAPQVRIGLHSGDLQRDGDGLTGSVLHIASRVAATADGGQILATGATIAESGVTPAGLPSAVSLRGVAQPMSIAQIPW